MEMEKKNLAIIILAVVLGASGIGNMFLLVELGLVEVTPPEIQNVIIQGSMYGPDKMDVQEMWESAAFQIAINVYEGLYQYNLSSPGLELTPLLAASLGTWVGPELTVTLRQGITFHDGGVFNATAVQWSFDRLNYWINASGDLPNNETEAQIAVLYRWPDGTPVINHTEVISEYVIKFVLNKPYGVFDALLTFSGSFIMSPYSNSKYTRIETSQAVGPDEGGIHAFVGTGPFIFEGYMAGIEVRTRRNDDYWREPTQVEALIWNIIQDADARNNALLAGDINCLTSPHPSFYDEMRSSSDVNLVEVDSPASSITQYLGFNNKMINKTWRQALSYGIDYDYMLTELLEGYAVRLRSPIPLGIAYANYSYDCAEFDIPVARGIIQFMGFGTGWDTAYPGTSEALWSAASFADFNYTYNIGNKFREDMLVMLQGNMDHIGVTVVDNGQEWTPYLDLIYNRTTPGYNGLALYFIGWIPDYNDPSNYVNSLMSNVSSSNSAQINDPYLEPLLRTGLEETDPVVRNAIYQEMQRYLIEDLMPWAWGYNSLNRDAFHPSLKGFPTNPWGYDYFYPCYFD